MKMVFFVTCSLLIVTSGCSSTKINEYKNNLYTDKPKILFGDITSSVSKMEINKNSKKLLYKIKTSI